MALALRITQQRRLVTRARDQFSKTTIRSTLEGIITYLPVNEGEIAIVGVQNQPGTVLMTIADMSVITAEVKVDETDIVNVKTRSGSAYQSRCSWRSSLRARFRNRQQRADGNGRHDHDDAGQAPRKRRISKSS